jgi:capsular exopolysaccharide synthesis family protein
MPDEKENRALPAPPSHGSVTGVPAVSEDLAVYPILNYGEPEESTAPLSHYWWVLRRHKWKGLMFVVACVSATVAVSWRVTPIYESTATIDIDRQAPAAIIGPDAAHALDDDHFLATQVSIIQSDSVLRPVAKRFHLARPAVEPQRGVSSTRAENAPIALKDLKATRQTGTYLLLISYRSPSAELAADVANAVAQSYIQHAYDIRFRAAVGLSTFMEKQLEELKAKMERSAEALVRFEGDLGVINPEEKTSILSARLLQLNTEFTSAQADRVAKQVAFNAVKAGSVEALRVSSQGDELRRLADRMDEARQKFAVVKAQYGANHPAYKKADSELAEIESQFNLLKGDITRRVGVQYQEALSREFMLQNAVATAKADYDRLNARSFEYKSLKQDADTDKGLYQELVRKIKEAGINSSFQDSSIRLADSARPGLHPVYPDIRMNAVIAFILSAMLAVGAAVAADALDNTVRDPDQIQRSLRIGVVGALPFVRYWRDELRLVSRNGRFSLVKSRQCHVQSAPFEEAVRTVRDSILLSEGSHRPRSLLITSAAPREGKTTTAVHLALAHSSQGRKTLLIDADLRRPGVHELLPVGNQLGVSDVAKDGADWRSLLQKLEAHPALDILPAGKASRREADQLGSVLEKLLAEAEENYDLVVIDSPPLLGFAEPLQIAAVAEGVVVITLAGRTNRNAIGSVLSSLKRVQANVIGIALNEVRQDMSDRYYYHGSYDKFSGYFKPLQS